MAHWASALRKEALDNATIRLNAQGKVSAGGIMEPFSAGTKGGAPSVFYVDGNVVSSGNGLSWLSAVKTLAEALVMAHAYMSTSGNRAWAQRATVYACGDALEEDLTKFAEKSDIIGVGTTNQHTHTRIDGTHVLEATSSDTYHGCQWFNFEFYGAAAGIIVDIPVGQNGQGFHGCKFSAVDGATIGLRAVQSHDMRIVDCWFDPNTSGTGFATAAIQINAGSVTNFLLQDCRIYSGAIGLDFNPTGATAINCWAIGNVMRTVGMGIDSESDNATSLIVVNNRFITLIDTDTPANGYDFNGEQSSGNLLTGSGTLGEDSIPPTN